MRECARLRRSVERRRKRRGNDEVPMEWGCSRRSRRPNSRALPRQVGERCQHRAVRATRAEPVRHQIAGGRRMCVLEHLRSKRFDSKRIGNRECVQQRRDGVHQRWCHLPLVFSGQRRYESNVHRLLGFSPSRVQPPFPIDLMFENSQNVVTGLSMRCVELIDRTPVFRAKRNKSLPRSAR
jgi:hypothetical protein